MGKWLSVMIAVLMVILLSSVASATSSVDSPLPSLQGADTILVFGQTGDRVGRDGLQGFYTLVTPYEVVRPVFEDTVRQLGGRKLSPDIPCEAGMYVMRFRVQTQIGQVTAGGLRVSWTEGIGGNYVPVTVRVDLQITQIEERRGRLIESPPLATRFAEGSSAAYNVGVDLRRLGSYHGTQLGAVLGRSKPFARAEQVAIENAVQALLDRSQRRTSANEPITVQDVDGDEVTLSAGSDTGVREGQNFAIFRKGVARSNQNTDEVLDQDVIYLGTVRVNSVRERVAFCDVIEGDPRMIAPGDHAVRSTGTTAKEAARPAVAPEPL
jgi:hypothetical protein